MEMQTLIKFFMWCTLINSALFLLWAVSLMVAPDLVYRTQKKWFPISRNTFNVVMYSLLGLFKIIVLVFNIIPLLALLIIS